MLSRSLLNAKAKASGAHFGVSLTIFLLVALWVAFVAYPSIYFTMSGATQGLLLVFCVDVVLGPLLSFLVYNPKKPKKEILSDFAIIGAVQIAALCYGLHTLYFERPRALIVYPSSTATVVTHRELADFGELGDLSGYTTLKGLPVAALETGSVQRRYTRLDSPKGMQILHDTDAFTRRTIAQLPEAQSELDAVDANFNRPYVIAVMAKYNGAYFALDKNGNFLQKFAEKPI